MHNGTQAAFIKVLGMALLYFSAVGISGWFNFELGRQCFLMLLLAVASWVFIGYKLELSADDKFFSAMNHWLLISMTFACIYGVIYSNSPNSFNLYEDWFEEDTLEELDELNRSIKQSYRTYFLVGLVESSADKVIEYNSILRTVTDSPESLPKDTLFLPDGHSALAYAFETVVVRPGKVAEGIPAHTVNARRLTLIGKDSIGLWSEDYAFNRREQLMDLIQSKTSTEIHEAASELKKSLSAKISQEISSSNYLVSNTKEMSVIDFVYLSFSISTTIGSVGIEPNSSITKMLVTFQSFMIVIFLGFMIEWAISSR